MAKISFDSFSNIINGQNRGSDKTYNGINPYTEEKLWDVPVASKKDLDDAVVAGNAAYKKWRQVFKAERKQRFKDFSDAVVAHKDEFTAVLQKEGGKSKELAEGEVMAGSMWLNAMANIDLPEHVTHEDDDVKVVTKYYPLGVVGAICPWNFPILLASGKIVGAVATGNTIIVKPSPYTPYTELKLVELAQQFFPAGVVQAVGGDDQLGPWMTKHPDIAKISFTGSSATGKKIIEAAAPTLKRVTLELGGNDASIICPDVDLDAIIPQVANDAFNHAGQICVAAKRLYVHSSIYDQFMDKFKAACKDLIAGQGYLSPIQNQMQYDKVKSVFDDCKTQKYNFALGNGDLQKSKSGYYIEPAIVAKPPDNSRLVQEEPFGPIVPVLTWDDEEDVISRANDTTQGLGATLWCKDTKRAERIAERLEAGSVWVNRGVKPMPTALFGGVKQSGLGGEWGPLGLLNFCDAHTIHFSKKG